MSTKSPRGTTNGNDRGSTETRRRRRVWMMETYASDVPGFVRCYRCGTLLYNEDDQPAGFLRAREENPEYIAPWWGVMGPVRSLTIDRIIPGTKGGKYVRNNIRPACGSCNSSTGSKLAKRGKRRAKPAV